jgi:hypothetical protein
MGARAKLWIKRLTAISLVLILVFVASYWKSTENIINKMDIDNEENYIIKLEAGEQGSVDLSTIGYYMALRIDGNDSSPELKLTDSEGVEIEGKEPGLIESINKRPDSQGNLIYVPIRVFEIKDNGEYSIVNEGNTTLWLIDDFKIQSSLFSDGWIMISMISCCLGFPLGIVTLIGALVLWKRGERNPGKNIMIQGTIMTTDELFKAHNQTTDKEIPEPFISSDNIESEIAEEKYHTIPELKNNKAELSEEESENKWKKWDEG